MKFPSEISLTLDNNKGRVMGLEFFSLTCLVAVLIKGMEILSEKLSSVKGIRNTYRNIVYYTIFSQD